MIYTLESVTNHVESMETSQGGDTSCLGEAVVHWTHKEGFLTSCLQGSETNVLTNLHIQNYGKYVLNN